MIAMIASNTGVWLAGAEFARSFGSTLVDVPGPGAVEVTCGRPSWPSCPLAIRSTPALLRPGAPKLPPGKLPGLGTTLHGTQLPPSEPDVPPPGSDGRLVTFTGSVGSWTGGRPSVGS